MKKTFLLLALSPLFFACGDGGSNEIVAVEGDIVSTLESGDMTPEELEEIRKYEEQEEQRIRELESTNTSLKYDRLKHDFGEVASGSENTTQFVVTNTGKNPLIISDVSATCGCTLPKKPEDPILPGESDVIEVTFKPKPGQLNEITKTVTVTANTDPKVSKVEIRAFVLE